MMATPSLILPPGEITAIRRAYSRLPQLRADLTAVSAAMTATVEVTADNLEMLPPGDAMRAMIEPCRLIVAIVPALQQTIATIEAITTPLLTASVPTPLDADAVEQRLSSTETLLRQKFGASALLTAEQKAERLRAQERRVRLAEEDAMAAIAPHSYQKWLRKMAAAGVNTHVYSEGDKQGRYLSAADRTAVLDGAANAPPAIPAKEIQAEWVKTLENPQSSVSQELREELRRRDDARLGSGSITDQLRLAEERLSHEQLLGDETAVSLAEAIRLAKECLDNGRPKAAREALLGRPLPSETSQVSELSVVRPARKRRAELTRTAPKAEDLLLDIVEEEFTNPPAREKKRAVRSNNPQTPSSGRKPSRGRKSPPPDSPRGSGGGRPQRDREQTRRKTRKNA